jgi:hypothetical protein
MGAKLTNTPLETGWPLVVYNVAVIVENNVVSDAEKDVGDTVNVKDPTEVADPILTVVACVTPPDSHLITAVPVVIPAINETTTAPGLPVAFAVVTVIVFVPLEKLPGPCVIVNVTGILDWVIGLPVISFNNAVTVEELIPSAGSDVGLAESVMEETCADVPIVTFVV